MARDIVSVALDKPQFLEIKVSERLALAGAESNKDVYRAKIDNEQLSIRTVTKEDGKGRVIFEVPRRVLERRSTELLLLCFSEN